MKLLAGASFPVGKKFRARGLDFDTACARFFGDLPPRKIGKAREIIEAARRGERLFVSLGPGKIWPVDGVNCERGTAQTILYVQAPGWTTTKTNRWGCEWGVLGGRVTDVFPPGPDNGNAAIPAGGFVISAHGYPPPSGYAFLRAHLCKGDRVEILVFSVPKMPVEAVADLGRGRKGVAVLLTAIYPAPGKADLAEMWVETTSGKRRPVRLQGSVSLPGFHQMRWHYSPKRGNGWRLWPAWFQYAAADPAMVLAYEWRSGNPGELARRFHLTVKPDGRMYGVTLLGVTAW